MKKIFIVILILISTLVSCAINDNSSLKQTKVNEIPKTLKSDFKHSPHSQYFLDYELLDKTPLSSKTIDFNVYLGHQSNENDLIYQTREDGFSLLLYTYLPKETATPRYLRQEDFDVLTLKGEFNVKSPLYDVNFSSDLINYSFKETYEIDLNRIVIGTSGQTYLKLIYDNVDGPSTLIEISFYYKVVDDTVWFDVLSFDGFSPENEWNESEVTKQDTFLGCVIPIASNIASFRLINTSFEGKQALAANFIFDTITFSSDARMIYYGKILEASGFTFVGYNPNNTPTYQKTTTAGQVKITIIPYSGLLGYTVTAILK
jgi:hypothetical protein